MFVLSRAEATRELPEGNSMRTRVITALATLTVGLAAGCGSGPADEGSAPTAEEQSVLPWTDMAIQYGNVTTKDCSIHPTIQLVGTCHLMLKSDITSMSQYATEALHVSKERTDLTIAINNWQETVSEFQDNMCFSREKAIECITGETLLNLKLTTIQGRIQQGVKAEQDRNRAAG